MKEYILCAAIWYKEFECNDDNHLQIRGMQPYNIGKGIVICGWRHGNCIAVIKALTGFRIVTLSADGVGEHIQGFLTNQNRFVDRYEAMQIAFEAGQVDESKVYYKDTPLPFAMGLELNEKPKYNPLFSEDLY